MRLWRAGCVLLVIARWAQPQDGGAAAPAFEVASIRPSGPHSIRGSAGGPGSSDPGLYRFGLATLPDLMRIAYNVRKWQVQSPIPLEPQAFDLIAKVPAGATKEQFRAMLQNLLADRFHLKLHTQSKEFPAYELLIAKTGFKLKEGTAAQPVSGKGWPRLRPTAPAWAANNSSSADGTVLVRIRSRQEPLTQLAELLITPTTFPWWTKRDYLESTISRSNTPLAFPARQLTLLPHLPVRRSCSRPCTINWDYSLFTKSCRSTS